MRHRFLTLDGLRGAAALAVVLFHLHSTHAFGGLFDHGYLAVDFFFLLSGFVIAHAYEERLRTTGAIRGFLLDRVIRLHPLLALSIVPALLVTLVQLALGRPTIATPLPTLLAAPIPFPALWLPPASAMVFPANVPSWSLFWELAINIAFALAVPRLSGRVLGVVIVASVVAAVLMSLASGGSGRTDVGAALRVLPSFAMGVMLLRLYRRGTRAPAWLGVVAAPLLVAVLAIPRFSDAFSADYDPAMAYLLFPLLVLAAARREARFASLCEWLGGLSYPLYILHSPLIAYPGSTLRRLGLPPVASDMILFSFALAVTWLAWRFYDEPVRAWLRRRLGSRGHRQPSD